MTILVGTDTSSSSDLAVEDAARLARDRGKDLVVVYVRSNGDVRSVVDPAKAADPSAYLKRMTSRFPGVTTRTRMESGDAAERLCEVAAEERAETIVIGNRGAQSARWHVKESVPNLVLRHAPCSVYIVDTRRAQ